MSKYLENNNIVDFRSILILILNQKNLAVIFSIALICSITTFFLIKDNPTNFSNKYLIKKISQKDNAMYAILKNKDVLQFNINSDYLIEETFNKLKNYNSIKLNLSNSKLFLNLSENEIEKMSRSIFKMYKYQQLETLSEFELPKSEYVLEVSGNIDDKDEIFDLLKKAFNDVNKEVFIDTILRINTSLLIYQNKLDYEIIQLSKAIDTAKKVNTKYYLHDIAFLEEQLVIAKNLNILDMSDNAPKSTSVSDYSNDNEDPFFKYYADSYYLKGVNAISEEIANVKKRIENSVFIDSYEMDAKLEKLKSDDRVESFKEDLKLTNLSSPEKFTSAILSDIPYKSQIFTNNIIFYTLISFVIGLFGSIFFIIFYNQIKIYI